ncbi:hypothetical protein MMSP_5392 [Mycobacterium sp. 012931]|nr:hypothetical protein MMSP_5392 [Mycobacterium sp. 012931]
MQPVAAESPRGESVLDRVRELATNGWTWKMRAGAPGASANRGHI